MRTMTPSPPVSTIIPTMAARERATSLKCAIASIRNSSAVPIKIIVVVNGNRFDTELCSWLREQPDVLYDQIEEGSLPVALARGRELVETEYFSFLDDDDVYLPGATDKKLEILSKNVCTDLVVCNGFRSSTGNNVAFYPRMTDILDDPLAALFHQNWLASCNAVFRSISVPVSFFEHPHPYAEWTWLAFRLAMANKRLKVVDEPGFRVNDTPGSLSKSDAYKKSYFSLYERMLYALPPTHIARMIRMRIGLAWHTNSSEALANGRLLDALASHVRSLLQPGGLRYLSYTRRLLPGWPKAR